MKESLFSDFILFSSHFHGQKCCQKRGLATSHFLASACVKI